MLTETKKDNSAFADFRQKGLQAFDDLVKVARDGAGDRIESAKKRLNQERVKLLIVGEFSRGKSTFINALLGEPILPSKVTPTTATINVIRGGAKRNATVRYSDGATERHELPPTRANHFLSEIVTASNAKAQKIDRVVITIPGRLDECLVDIVDTPGVNDLDKLREDVTHHYLKHCDAVVVLLDAQQPLTESERRFLKQRVVGADISKMIFVVNRVDEQIADHDDQDPETLIRNVRNRLQDQAGIAHPKVYALSALQTLKARFKGESNHYQQEFQNFETDFFDFANTQATSGRVQSHVDRFLKIAHDSLISVENELTAIDLEGEALQAAIDQQHQKLKEAKQSQRQIPKWIDAAFPSTESQLLRVGMKQLKEAETSLKESLGELESASGLDHFPSQLRREMRDVIDSMSEFSWNEAKNAYESISKTKSELFSSSASLINARATSSFIEMKVVSTLVPEYTSNSVENFNPSDAIWAGLIGTAASFVVSGPLAILAGIAAFGLSGSVRKEMALDSAFEGQKEQIVAKLATHLAQYNKQIPEAGRKIYKRDREQIMTALVERAGTTIERLEKGIEALKKSATTSTSERTRRKKQLEDRKRKLVGLMKTIRRFATTREIQG